MSGRRNFVDCDVDLKEWINKLYSDIEYMKSFLEKHSYNITRADLDLSNHYHENTFVEAAYCYLSLKPVFEGQHNCTDFIIQVSNPELIKSGFFDDKEVEGKSFRTLTGESGEKFFAFLKQSFEHKKPMISEYYHSEIKRAYRVITQPQADMVHLLLQDITSEQLYHLSVKRYENLFSKAQEVSSSGFFQYNTYNQELYVTEGVLSIFECLKSMNITERIKLKDYLYCVHDDDKEMVLSKISDEKLTSNLDYQHRILVRDKIKYVHVKGSAFYDPIDDSISLIGIVEDITKSKEVELELAQIRNILNEIEKLSQIAFWEYDFLTDKFTGTPETVKILGISENNLPLSFGEFLNLVHKKDQKNFYEGYHQSLGEHRDWESDCRIVDKFGVLKDVHIICRNRFDSKGRPVSSKGFLCNQTELKRYEYASSELVEVKQELTDLKQQFNDQLNEKLTEIRIQDKYHIQKYKYTAINDVLSHLSEKWLNSLNLLSTQIHNWVEAFDCGELSSEKFHQIHETTKEQIAELSANMECFRKYYPGRQNKGIFEAEEVLQDIMEAISESCKAEGIKLKLDVEGKGRLLGNASEFRQALMEIIKNSREEILRREIEKPKITIKTRIEDGKYIINITDNAGGITEGIKDRIFEPYYSAPEKSGTTGLGLYMSKMIIEKTMNGNIIASNHNSGALFEISISLAK